MSVMLAVAHGDAARAYGEAIELAPSERTALKGLIAVATNSSGIVDDASLSRTVASLRILDSDEASATCSDSQRGAQAHGRPAGGLRSARACGSGRRR